MGLPSSGSISMDQVRRELGRTSGAISLGEAAVRALAGKPSGAISMNDLRGKSAVFKGIMNIGHGGEIYGRVFSRGWSSNPALTGSDALMTGFGKWNNIAHKRIHIPTNGLFSGSKDCWMYSILGNGIGTVPDDISFYDKDYHWNDTVAGNIKPINIGTNRLKVTISGFGVRYFTWKLQGTAYNYYSEQVDNKIYDYFASQDTKNVTITIEKA